MDRSIRVIYTDADAESAEQVASELESVADDISVDLATSADTVLERLKTETVDCLITTTLPETDTWEFFEELQAVESSLPVVFFASEWDDDIPSRVRTTPKTACVERTENPTQYQLLVNRIHDLVDDDTAKTTQGTDWRPSDGFPDIVFLLDEDGRYEDIIAGGDSPLLYDDADALLGKRLRDVFQPADGAQFQDAIDRALATGEIQTIKYQLDVKAGQRWFESRVAPVETDTGDASMVTWVARDITEQKRREVVLKTLHETAKTIHTAETVEEACERTVDAATEILAFDMCTVIIREDDWLVPYATSEDAPSGGSRRMRIDQGLAGKTIQTGETYLLDEVTADSDADPANESYRSGLSVPIGEYGVFQAVSTEPNGFDSQDATFTELLVSHTASVIERIKRETELTRQRERLDEFASLVSHDLRNPLNVATLRLSLVAEECESEHLPAVEEALGRMEQLVEELLTLARLGETVGETEPVDLAALVERCWMIVETTQATMTCDTDRVIHADESRLASVLENLFRNAIEHGREDTHITVGTTEDGFYIEDNGDGIPAAERDHIFESGYSTKEDGTGFGLAIVREVVAAHGWEIRATESATGGARFEITGVEFAD